MKYPHHNVEAIHKRLKRAQMHLGLRNQQLKDYHTALLQNEHARMKEFVKGHPGLPLANEFQTKKRTINGLLQDWTSQLLIIT